MKHKHIIILGLVVLVTSCSPHVKLLKSWDAEAFNQAATKIVLVAARTPDAKVQKTYETALVKQLQSKGVKAIALHQKFSDLMYKKERSEAEVAEILARFKKEHISTILMTSLKDQFTTTEVVTEKTVGYINDSRGKYFFVFDADDITKLPDFKKLDNGTTKVDNEVKVIRETTYVLEALTYDISLPKEKQLVNVRLVNIVNPKSSEKVLKKFTSIVTKPF